ncbi:hypothetical protein PanWU01x14_257960, partial [Parasponia andersonii]
VTIYDLRIEVAKWADRIGPVRPSRILGGDRASPSKNADRPGPSPLACRAF